MNGLHHMGDPLADGYECECGWTGPMTDVAVIDGEECCPVSWCRSLALEPIRLCTDCHDDKAGDNGLCVGCDPEETEVEDDADVCEHGKTYNEDCAACDELIRADRRDQVAPVLPLVRA